MFVIHVLKKGKMQGLEDWEHVVKQNYSQEEYVFRERDKLWTD